MELIQIYGFSLHVLPEAQVFEADWNQNSYGNYLLFIINNEWL